MNTRVDRYWQWNTNARNLIPGIAAYMMELMTGDVAGPRSVRALVKNLFIDSLDTGDSVELFSSNAFR